MRYALMVLWLLLSSVASAYVQVSVGIALPGLSIGINLPAYPELVVVPGYPVYYAPRLQANYFFYDGMYWLFAEDNWYVSYWYNGPWDMVYPDYVPLFILRVPVYYYRWPPRYFRGWRPGGPPHWGDHWGHDWERRHSGWNQWNLSVAPPPAPLPDYQREYDGDRYPSLEQQQKLHNWHYHYEPHDAVVRLHYQRQEERREQPSPSQWQDRQGRQYQQGEQIEQRQQRWEAEPQQRSYPHQRIQPYQWPSTQQQVTPGRSRVVTPPPGDEYSPRSSPPVMIQQRTPETRYQRQAPQEEVVRPERQVQAPEMRSQERPAPQQSRQYRRRGAGNELEGDGGR